MKHFYLLHLLAGLVTTTSAQIIKTPANPKAASVTGQLKDKLYKQPVPGAIISVINGVDSSLVAFTRTDSFGRFYFSRLLPGRYLLSASQIHFRPQWTTFELTAADTMVHLEPVLMQDKNVLEEVSFVAQRPPVEVNGDTLEFNAGSFKTKPNAVMEDMLKKMPGIEVDKDGTVRVNGKQINRVFVNGKDFFNGDPKMATRNVSADAIDKVQVFDKQSDQAAFTGIDDGNAEKVINLKLKKNKKSADFGKMSAAPGSNNRYDAQFNINKFTGDRQLSAIGMVNNTNLQGFSIMDILNFTGESKKMMGGGGGMVISTREPQDIGLPVNGITNNEGIITTIAGGINYSDSWKNKTDVNASYFYNNLMPEDTRIVNRQNILPSGNFTWQQNNTSNNTTTNNRFNFSADHKIDSFNAVKITSVIGYQKGTTDNQSTYKSFIPQGETLNNGFTNTTGVTNGCNTENTLLYRHKFKKRSRTFSLNTSWLYNDSRSNGTQKSINNFFFNGATGLRDTLDQLIKLATVTQSYGANLSYTEPLSKRSLLEFKIFYNTTQSDPDRHTFDVNQTNGKHDLQNKLLSNSFESRYNYRGTGIALRTQRKKFGYTVGTRLQYAQLSSRLKDSAFYLKQHFRNLLPTAGFNYNFTKIKSLRLDYTTSTSQPNASQLQPVKDISDPLNVKEGNPALQQSYNHNLAIQFFNANPSKQQNLFVFVNYFSTQHAIVNSDVTDTAGIRTTRPVNANGVHYIAGTADKGFRIKKLNTRFTIGGNIAVNHSVSFINDQRNTTRNFSFAPRASVNYTYKDMVDINFATRLSYNQVRYSLQPLLDNNFWRQNYELDATFNFPAGFTVSNEFTYSVFTGRASGFNKNMALWNATLSKEVLKSKKGSIRVSAYDLLKQNIGIDRNTGSNYVEDVQYRVLQRFFTIGFIYSLQKPVSGGPKAIIRTL